MKIKKIYFCSAVLILSCKTLNKSNTDYSSRVIQPETAIYAQNWDERKIAALPAYAITGKCDGYPKVNLKTAPGFCVGLIDNGEGMTFPRTALEVAPGKIVVVDMGGWKESNGKLYLIESKNGVSSRKTILDGSTSPNKLVKTLLDRPHLISKGPNNKVFLSSTSMIATLDPLAPNVESTIQVMIQNIPNKGLHPLKAYAFDVQNNIYINVGSATNICKKQGVYFEKFPDCSEVEDMTQGQAQIRKYFYNNDGTYSKNFVVYAKGLRNSMGLHWSQKLNSLMQIENGRDNINEYDTALSNLGLPHEELNMISEGQHYGWPYCYDNNLNNPEWSNVDCSKYQKPTLLLPPHSSPLSLLKYQGSMFPEFYKNKLLISLHGYESQGHRIVIYDETSSGIPTGSPLSIVYGWDAKGTQALGSPVGLTQLSDGSVLIVEDKSRKVLRLFYDSKLGNGNPIDEIPKTVVDTKVPNESELRNKLEAVLSLRNPPIFAKIQSQLIDKYCIGCHSGTDARGIQLAPFDFMGNENRILTLNKKEQLLKHLQGEAPYAQMPPDGFPNDEEQKRMITLYLEWMNQK